MIRCLCLMLAMAVLSAPAASAEVALTQQDDGFVLSWETSQEGFSSIMIRVLPGEPGEDLSEGALLTTLEPDPDTGLLPSSWMLPRSFVVIPGTCIGCGLCVGQCPVDAIELVGGKALIDPASCIACGICSMTCPTSAIFSLGSGMHYTVTAVDAEGRLLLVGSI